MNSPESTHGARPPRDRRRARGRAARPRSRRSASFRTWRSRLRADAPEPDAEFAAADARARGGGLPAGDGLACAPGSRPAPCPQLHELVPAAGFAGMLLVAPCASPWSLPNGGSGRRRRRQRRRIRLEQRRRRGLPRRRRRRRRRPIEQASAAKSSASRPSLRPARPRAGGGFAPGRSDRRIERSVALELGAPVDQMERLAEHVTAVTNRYGGFVLSSSLSTGEDGAGGDFDLRIPAARLRPALRDLSALAHGPLAEPVGPRRDAPARDRPGPPALGARRARQPAAPPGGGRHRRGGRGPPAPARPGGDRDPRPALAAPRPAPEHQLRHRARSRSSRRTAGSGAGGGTFDDAVDDAGDLLVGTAGSADPRAGAGPAARRCWPWPHGSADARSGAAGASRRSSDRLTVCLLDTGRHEMEGSR